MPLTGGSALGCVAALDVGGTKIEAGVVDPRGGVLARARIPTPPDHGGVGAAQELFASAAELLAAVIAEASVVVDAVGVGCGGPMDASTVSPLNITQWRRFPLRAALVAEFGLPVGVDNDAKALALAEGAHGAASDVENFLAMVVSTGVGGGLVLDGRLLDGAMGNAGHIGHLVVDPQGRRCGCGGRGCLEAQVSGTAIAEITGRPASEADLSVRRWAGRLVGRAVGSVCNLLDLQLAVLAGSVSIGFGAPFVEAAQQELDRVARLPNCAGARIRIGGLAADGPLVGAACVGRLALSGTDL
ncbi:MAG: ROK family protein [Microthrixaceae bacterium]|nr:ROK family protein [Microthrixaceae bacterium]